MKMSAIIVPSALTTTLVYGWASHKPTREASRNNGHKSLAKRYGTEFIAHSLLKQHHAGKGEMP
jgi:hypothetical protein